MTRDHARELRLLYDALGAASPTHAYIAEVRGRLEEAEQTHGDSWATRPAEDLIAEALEETIDTAAWLLLAEQRLDAKHAETRHAIRQAIAASEQAWQALKEVQ